MRRPLKRDTAEAGIVEALEKVGCSVLRLEASQAGAPDLLVLRAGKLFLMEVKTDRRQARRKSPTSKAQKQ